MIAIPDNTTKAPTMSQVVGLNPFTCQSHNTGTKCRHLQITLDVGPAGSSVIKQNTGSHYSGPTKLQDLNLLRGQPAGLDSALHSGFRLRGVHDNG